MRELISTLSQGGHLAAIERHQGNFDRRSFIGGSRIGVHESREHWQLESRYRETRYSDRQEYSVGHIGVSGRQVAGQRPRAIRGPAHRESANRYSRGQRIGKIHSGNPDAESGPSIWKGRVEKIGAIGGRPDKRSSINKSGDRHIGDSVDAKTLHFENVNPEILIGRKEP